MSMLDLSKHILSVGKEKGVTNLQMQKVMYFAIKDYLNKNGSDNFINEVYDEPFETWQYGPVVPELYYRYSKNGSMAINDEGAYNEEYSSMDDSIKKYLNKNVFDLVEKSHEESFWQKHQGEAHRREEYSLKDIMGD